MCRPIEKQDVMALGREAMVEILADMFVRLDQLQPGNVSNQAQLFQDALNRYNGYPTDQPPTDGDCQWCCERLDDGRPLANNGRFHENCWQICCLCTREIA